MGQETLSAIAADIQKLQTILGGVARRHHVESCPRPESEAVPDAGESDVVNDEAGRVKQACEYASAFKASYEKAKKRITVGKLHQKEQRASASVAPWMKLTPWLQAQIDIYEMIIASIPGAASTPMYHALADVGQSAYRGAISVQGTLPSISTSSRLFSYQLKRRTP